MFKQGGPKGLNAMAQALFTAAEVRVMTPSKRTYVPVDSGTLRASGFIEKPVIILGSKAKVVMGYGGAAKSYALIVHEDPRGVVPRPGGQGGPKYLERPFNAAKREIVRDVAKAVGKALERKI